MKCRALGLVPGRGIGFSEQGALQTIAQERSGEGRGWCCAARGGAPRPQGRRRADGPELFCVSYPLRSLPGPAWSPARGLLLGGQST